MRLASGFCFYRFGCSPNRSSRPQAGYSHAYPPQRGRVGILSTGADFLSELLAFLSDLSILSNFVSRFFSGSYDKRKKLFPLYCLSATGVLTQKERIENPRTLTFSILSGVPETIRTSAPSLGRSQQRFLWHVQ